VLLLRSDFSERVDSDARIGKGQSKTRPKIVDAPIRVGSHAASRGDETFMALSKNDPQAE
jgi:hypothetical protein